MNKILLFREQFLQKFKDFFRSTVFDEEGVVESPNYLNYFLKKIQNASILMIPTAFNSGKLFVQEPTNRNEDFDVIRNSTVPRTNQYGNWEEAPVNTPCIDYSTGEPLLLTQPQSTNLITYSEDFSDSSWLKQGSGLASVPLVTPNVGTSPKGTINADKIVFGLNGGTTGSDLSQLTFALGSLTGDYTSSIYLKSFDGTSYDVSILNPNGGINAATINSDWQRFEYYNGGGSTVSNVFRLRLRGGESTSDYAALLIWGAQLESQLFATSYIPTNGGVATRLGDTIQNAGSTDTINSEEGVLYFEGAALVEGGVNRGMTISDGTTSNYILFKYDASDNQVRFIYRNNDVNEVLISKNSVNVLEINSFAIAWDDEKLYTYVNEILHEFLPILNTFSANTLNTIGFNVGGNGRFESKTKQLRVYRTQEDASKDLPYIIPFDADFLQFYKDFINEIRNIGGITEKKTYTDNLLKQALNASIVNVPTSYGVGKLFNQSPSNRLEDFDVIRNSNVFRRAPNGLLEEIGANVPCIDYATGEPLLLTQPQSTNLINYSEDFTQWGGVNGILTSNATESPTGDLNAAEIQNASVGTVAVYQRNLGVVNAGNNTYSIYVKYKDGDIRFNLRTGGTGSSASIFTISENGVTLVSSIRRTKIEDVGNGWFRISVDFDTDGISNINAQLRGDTNGTTNAFYIWGAQVEGQPFATSYIPTNGGVATRLADVIENAGSTNTINSEEGVFHFKSAAFFEGETYRNISISDGTSSNFILFRYDLIDNQVRAFYKNNNVTEGAIIKDNVNVLDINSFDLIWNDETLKLYVNEVFHQSVSLSNTFSANTLSKVDFYLAGNNFEAKTKELRVYKSIAQAQIDLPYIT